MLAHLRIRTPANVALAALALALTIATPLAPTPLAYAQSSTGCSDPGPTDYPIAGGWFYTQEARGCIVGVGPARRRGYRVVDDDKGAFWTEFRRYGGPDVLGYPVSQPFHYPVSDVGGLWYQAFERGILQWHPETGRAEMANVFEMFTDQGLDYALLQLGIPLPEPKTTASFAADAERRMSWLTEPRMLARYFFDPVGPHSSDPQRAGLATFSTQEQAWSFFGLPQSPPEQPFMLSGAGQPCTTGGPAVTPCLTSLDPLVHTFVAQRLQKGGMQLFVQSSPNETFLPAGWNGAPSYLLDPTIVPGDGVTGCVALTAVGLLARTVGADRIIPTTAIQALPVDPTEPPFVQALVPAAAPDQTRLQFQLAGSAFGIGEPVTIRLTDANPDPQSKPLPAVTSHVVATNLDGSFDQILTARIGIYDLVATSDVSAKTAYAGTLNLNVPTVGSRASSTATTCRDVGLPIQASSPVVTP
jgi:LGFP repeat